MIVKVVVGSVVAKSWRRMASEARMDGLSRWGKYTTERALREQFATQMRSMPSYSALKSARFYGSEYSFAVKGSSLH